MTTFAIKNSVTGQTEQLVEDDSLEDVLAFLNAADVKEGGEAVEFESEKFVPPVDPPEDPALTPPDQD